MDRRNFLLSISGLLSIPVLQKKSSKPNNNPQPKQEVFKLMYQPPCAETLASILVLSSSNKSVLDIDIEATNQETLLNNIVEIVKNLQKKYPNHRLIFEKNPMFYTRDEYDSKAETSLENLLKQSGQSRRDLLSSLFKKS
jgi:hypothetical protein